jgi:predicted component of type VI protein secretion system
LPCIVNRHPVMEWMIGQGGRAIDMSERNALAACLAELLHDNAKRQSLHRAARRHCLEHFAKAPVLDRILQYYGQVLGRKKSVAEALSCV